MNFKQKYGPWAVVTGASSGIGREFAQQIAAAGLNVVLVARRRDRLESLSAEITNKYPVETRIVEADLTDPDSLEKIASATEDLDIGLLINNAGAGFPGAFLKGTLESRSQVLQLNVMAAVQLTYHFGNKMRQRGRGGLLMVSSVGALLPGPYLAAYTATKAFLLNFGESLSIELKNDNIDVTVLLPGATRTEMAEKEGANFDHVPEAFWYEAEFVAGAALKALGRKTIVVPGFMTRLNIFIMTRLLPRKKAAMIFGDTIKKAIDKSLV